MEYLDQAVLERLSAESFLSRKPYPWVSIPHLLTPDGYEVLRANLPDASRFKVGVGLKRAFGQASHDRAILHYNPELDLPRPWREFITELEGEKYMGFCRRMFALPPGQKIIPTMEWYYAWQACSVSPHCDARRKIGTHIFYFNTEEDWHDDWGGEILILDDGGRLKAHSGPQFEDLAVAASLDARGNSSLLFRRTDHSWHGVRPLSSPENSWRRLFLITLNAPTFQVLWRRVRGKDPDGQPLHLH